MTDPAMPDSQMPDSQMPDYKGAPLEAERGPGLGCFWIQIVLLIALLILTPLSVLWAWPSIVSAALLILSLVLLFFVGQTMIFLLRLVAADRRSRRRPLGENARRTVGQLEDQQPAKPTYEPQVGARVNIVKTPQTESAGFAGRTGTYSGWTTPSVSAVEVIGKEKDVAFGVTFDDGVTAWFDPLLIERASDSHEDHTRAD